MFETNGYLGFTFAEHHSSEFGLLVVSDGSRYHRNLYNRFSDSVVTTPGKNGGYFFGTQITQKDFDINCVFYDTTSHSINKIQQWLYPNKVGWLIFDEYPYKRYLVKISAVPMFNFIPFEDFKEAEDYKFQKEILKGEVRFSFFGIEEYATRNPKYELPIINKEMIVSQQALDSGIIPKGYKRNNIYLSGEQIKNLKAYKEFNLYNAGNGITEANFDILIGKSKFPLKIFNYDDGVTYKITDPIEIFKNKKLPIDDIVSYRIFINSNKKEIIAKGYLNNEEYTEEVNIGACYNHYFPKVYHIKPTETCIFSQSIDNNMVPDSVFYTFSYKEKDLGSSDKKVGIHTFEEFQQYWSDYIILTKCSAFQVNRIVSPAAILVDFSREYNNHERDYENIILKELGYLVYPNKYMCNQDLQNFTAFYEDTYI